LTRFQVEVGSDCNGMGDSHSQVYTHNSAQGTTMTFRYVTSDCHYLFILHLSLANFFKVTFRFHFPSLVTGIIFYDKK